jgi:hypothetical protein
MITLNALSGGLALVKTKLSTVWDIFVTWSAAEKLHLLWTADLCVISTSTNAISQERMTKA